MQCQERAAAGECDKHPARMAPCSKACGQCKECKGSEDRACIESNRLLLNYINVDLKVAMGSWGGCMERCCVAWVCVYLGDLGNNQGSTTCLGTVCS